MFVEHQILLIFIMVIIFSNPLNLVRMIVLSSLEFGSCVFELGSSEDHLSLISYHFSPDSYRIKINSASQNNAFAFAIVLLCK